MFDEQKEPEDIFSEADKVAPQVSPPTTPPPAAPAMPVAAPAQPSVQERIAAISVPSGAVRSFSWKPAVLVLAILVVVVAAFYLSVKILSSRTPVTPEPPGETGNREPASAEASAGRQGTGSREQAVEEAEVGSVAPGFSPGTEETIIEEESEPVVPSTVDTDKDGLTDEEEAAAGTSPRSADTDGDGLFDSEEINTWETDPVNPDTDGDGYLDGQEVSGGYNPKGEGKLLEASTESD